MVKFRIVSSSGLGQNVIEGNILPAEFTIDKREP